MTPDEIRAQALAAITDKRLRSLVALFWLTEAERRAQAQARHPAPEPQPLRGTRRKNED